MVTSDFTSKAWSQMYIDPSEHFPYFPPPPRLKSIIKLFSQGGGDEVGKDTKIISPVECGELKFTGSKSFWLHLLSN